MGGKMRVLKNQKGFSVLETIMSTVVLAVGLVGGMVTTQNTLINSERSGQISTATIIAQSKMEEVLADHKFRGFDYITDSSNYPTENLSGNYQGYQQIVEIVEINSEDLQTPEEDSDLALVTIKVIWGSGSNSNVEVKTILGRSGAYSEI